MAPRVHAPVKDYTGTVAGVAFVDGSGETENGAALAYFQRKGYRIEDAKPVKVEPVEPVEPVKEEPAKVEPVKDEQVKDEPAKVEPVKVEPVEPVEPVKDEPVKVEPVSTKPERPHPVQGNKAAWFDYLTEIKPDHGFDLEKVQRKELIEAANEVDGITAE